ncbi:four helix bundle protein [Sabulilitoribacter arenilitoris]|uniref:Four helix bundle protein n=1 Tax=Wocania arenilitoris TaxID=2044858 RepID=A0AAE3EQ22_9FLAO|nr:four helix bundle protein [Wocania arenilitoris]MCF7569096.1 four helix bundle protein [Wocania arenilitoris]
MAYTFSFKKLNVWFDYKELVKHIYLITREYPSEEKFGLTNSLRRASIFMAFNLAEDTSRTTNKDKAYFPTQAFSSLMEVLNQIIIAKELFFLDENEIFKDKNRN